MPKNETTKLVVASVPEKSSYFFEWSQYRMIQCQQNIMYALDNSLTVKNLTEKRNEISLDMNSEQVLDDQGNTVSRSKHNYVE